MHGKPVLIYTLENFQNHPLIDHIILVCLESWMDYAAGLMKKFGITKVAKIVPGGATGQESIFMVSKRQSPYMVMIILFSSMMGCGL